ncbi:hypothetical protein G7046_g4900 [Stylonectria norvegica]|nr:hypothetical protein G7046_g4900 [Stylonectria norvegica]
MHQQAPSQDEDQNEYILKEIYVPPPATDKSSSEQELVDLVFVHGLGGNLRGTWKQEGTHEPWFSKPEFLGRLKGNVRALSFGYNANRFGDVANTRIIHHANDLLRNLVLKRLDEPNRPLILIAHSLGGLIVKRAILLCATNDDWGAIKSSTKSIIFMGTPHMGSEKAEDLVVVQKLASLMKFQTPIATNLSKELKIFSTAVQDINMEFTIDVHRSIELLCCYESHPQRLPNGSKEIIVPQWSAVLQGVDNIDLNCTHSALSKFASPHDPRFELFWGEVQRLVRKATAPSIKMLRPAPTWTDEEGIPSAPARPRQAGPSRRRPETTPKGPKTSRASIIRSSANEILKEVQSRMPVATAAAEPESTVSQMKDREQLVEFDPKEFSEFLRQLRTITPENKGHDREQPHWSTCQWILNDAKFNAWRESEQGGLLFITGSPGCGKSNLAKYIQGVMEKPGEEDGEDALVISFYCDSLESSRVNPPILDLMVKSLFGKRRALPRHLRQKLHTLLETHTVTSEPRFNFLMELVRTLVMDRKGIPACLIIDGLDQCEDEFILKLLRGLDTIFRGDGSTSTLKVAIISRMADSIRGFALANSHIEITPSLTVEDIQQVVDEEVDRILMARQIVTIGRSSVSAVIVERANGSFLFASSVLKELWYIKDTGANSVFTLVTSCPSTMEAIYQQDMDRLETERPDLFRLVQIICIAKRAIRISEAREILRVQNPDITENYDLIGDLARMCQRLIKFGSGGTLELLHQTLYDFIINTYDIAVIHNTLAGVCLEYLSTLNWEAVLLYQKRHRRSRRSPPFPFLAYASPWMGYHWRNAGKHATKKAWEIWNFINSKEGDNWQEYPKGARPPPRSFSRSSSRSSGSSRIIHPGDRSYTSSSNSDSSESSDSSDSEEEEPADQQQGPAKEEIHDAGEESDSSDTSSLSVIRSSSDRSRPTIPRARLPKPPLIILAQWDVDVIVKELFFEALESSPRQLLHRFLGMMPYISHQSSVTSRDAFRAMINDEWEGTTAVHYAAAQSGRVLELMLPFVDDINLPDDDGATPLILAAASGEILGVSILLEAGAEIDHCDCWSQTALYSALHANSAEVVRALLEAGANVNIPADSGHSPLEVTVGKNQLEYAQILLEYSPDLDAPMTTGRPPAFLASRLGSHEVLEALLPYIDIDQVWDGERIIHNTIWRGLESIVKKLIKLGANLNDPPINTPKATPVALAAECGHNSILKALLAAGASYECPVPMMSAALHIAASRGNVDACKQLIRAGCDIEAESERGRTALYVACDTQRVAVVELLVSHGADPNKPAYEPPLQIAADVGNFAILLALLGGRISPIIDRKGDTDETALGIASIYGDLDMVTSLLDHGADPNLRSGKRTSNTPLQLAASGKHGDTMIELLRRGADPFPWRPRESSAFHNVCIDGLMDVVDVFFEVVDNVDELIKFEWDLLGTPLVQAALGGHLKLVQLLLEKGADPNYTLNTKINKDMRVIHAAAEGGNVEIFEAVMAAMKEPDFEVRDFKNRTPLHYACEEGREDMVKYLLDKGAQTDVVLTTGENLTASIVDGGSAKILNWVLEKNPDMETDSTRSPDGKSPLFFAVQHRYNDILSILLDRGADVNRYSQSKEFPLMEAIRFRGKQTLQILLEHKKTNLTQLDAFGRNSLQIAQASGSHPMPGMILAAAKDPQVERVLLHNRDMYGMDTYAHTRFDTSHQLPWEECLKAIRREAKDLIDNFSPRGPRWERLGKFLLRGSAYTLAQLALQRNVKIVESVPLYLKHEVVCRLCLDVISTTRYTCKSCCETDLCEACIGRYSSLGYRMWTCQYHIFYQVDLPGTDISVYDRASDEPSYSLANHHPVPLSPIAEESEDGWDKPIFQALPFEEAGPGQKVVPTESKAESVITEDAEEEDTEVTVYDAKKPLGNVSKHDAFVSPPGGHKTTPPARSNHSDDEDDSDEEKKEDKSELQALRPPPPPEEYVELTDDQLRELLEAVLTVCTEFQTPEGLVKWKFNAKKWKLEYTSDAKVRQDDNDEKMMDSLRPSRVRVPSEEQSKAFEYLSAMPYQFTRIPLVLYLTQLPFKTYHRRAGKKRKQMQKLISKLDTQDRAMGEAWSDVDE